MTKEEKLKKLKELRNTEAYKKFIATGGIVRWGANDWHR